MVNFNHDRLRVEMNREPNYQGSGRTQSSGSGRSTRALVAEVLRRATARLVRAGVESPRLDAEWLLMAALGWGKEAVYRNLRCQLEDEQRSVFDGLVSRRCMGEPAAYIVGKREFWSLEFKVNGDVLVPRPETEHLVETGLEFLDSWTGPRRILEIGTGSGAVAVSLAHERRDIEVWATDISARALDVARHNARQHGMAELIHFCEGDLFGALDAMKGPFAAIFSNPPYVASADLADLPREVRDWEPLPALDGGPDALDLYRRIISGGAHHLYPGGLLALEIGSGMAEDVCELFRIRNGFNQPVVGHDYAGHERLVCASLEDMPKSEKVTDFG